jgi:two-component system sensor histidine kinase UhpB
VGAYVALNAVLIGSFGFAAIYHLVLWSQSRREPVLLIFAFHCALLSVFSACLVAIVMAQTPGEGQRALDWRIGLGALGQVSSVWLLSLITGVRARWFVWSITAVFLTAAVTNAAILPLAGTVTSIDRIVTPWGEQVSILHRELASRWLGPLYLLVVSITIFGFICAVRLGARDRISGVLLAMASGGSLIADVWGVRIDVSGSQGLYVGAVPYAAWVLLVALEIARDYRLRGDRLAAAERRFRAIFDQTFQFIGLMTLDGTLLEANDTALRFAGVAATDVIGKPFWDTPWWTHSSSLQAQLRHAVRAAAAGEMVRFEATHRAADGRLHHIDFSLKPVYDDHGAVVLLIPEGRDITEQKEAQQALEESREQLQRLTGGLLLAREEERTTIAREVHDVLGQSLTALKMDMAWIGRRVPDDTPEIGAKLAEMVTLVDDTVATIRRIAADLRPGVLDDLGLAAAVEWQADEFEHRTGIQCALRATIGEGAFDPLVSTAVFRIFQESLANVARHSRASCVAVTLERRDTDLVLEVRDDGIGIAAVDVSHVRSSGLVGMRERAQLVGGRFSISGAAGAGTTVLVHIPWQGANV